VRVDTIIAPQAEVESFDAMTFFSRMYAQIKTRAFLPLLILSLPCLRLALPGWLFSFEMPVVLHFCVLMSKYMDSSLKLEYRFRMFGSE
jgi:hypothetical protein